MKRAEKVADKGARAKSILNFSNGDGDVKRASERVPLSPSAALSLSLSPLWMAKIRLGARLLVACIFDRRRAEKFACGRGQRGRAFSHFSFPLSE